tara:strand:- start:867 stop:1292 length:426 start_codon:yes stop_codon:yes gene_type:complete
MNATPHTVIGYSMIKLAGGNPFGCLLAFISHLVADYIGESGGIKTPKQRVFFDIIPTIILFIASYFYGGLYEVWLVALGSIFGNMPDLIDKKLYLAIIYPTKFKATLYLHWQKAIYNPKPIFIRYQGFGMVIFVLITYIIK